MFAIKFIYIFALFRVSYCWYTCNEILFCEKIRNDNYGESTYRLEVETISISQSGINIDLINSEDDKTLNLNLNALENDVFRITIDDPNKPRHSVPEAINGELPTRDILISQGDSYITVSSGLIAAVLYYQPFKINIYRDDEIISEINPNGKLVFKSEEDDEAIALDFRFPNAERAYGIPLHAERLSLKTTGPNGLHPYRLFNVDNCCYPVDSQEPLYGSVPVLYAHSTTQTSGIFWLNSAQTFVDINNGDDSVDAHIISESGIIELFVLTGPTLEAATKQYTKITGTAPLPPYFAIAYHQSRYTYMSQYDLIHVVKQFDNNDFPVDVLWLDIDYTDSFKYFTWDYMRFPRPVEMQQQLNETGRKLVLIIDPHIKVEEGYSIYDTATANGYFVKNPDGSDFVGECWPGDSSYLDFNNPNALSWYASLYGLDTFPDATDVVFYWNDMNEPSVFNQDEQTMPNYLVHYGDVLHRDVHNMYGFMQTLGTWTGLMSRLNNQQRPFLLTRSHFAGSQRYAAIWTGDNMSTWEHLKVSFSMCLTEALAGISFCGADIGGFVTDVDTELLQRWHQAGAWLPFYRQHSSIYVRRREPYLYSQDEQYILRNAIRDRYHHLPYWYTTWYEHERNGDPVIRPLCYHYSTDINTLDIDDQWLVGQNILVHPIVEEGATKVTVYFPGGEDQVWLDISNNFIYKGSGYADISVNINSIPVFYRGGSIVFRKDTPRPSSALMREDPFSLYILLDENNQATGNLYCDDNESLSYRNKEYFYYRFVYSDTILTSEKIDEDVDYPCTSNIGNIYVYNLSKRVNKMLVNDEESNANISSTGSNKVEITNLNINMNSPFVIRLV